MVLLIGARSRLGLQHCLLMESFSEQESYERCVIQRCCPDLVKMVRELRNFFWQRIYRRSLTEVQLRQVLQVWQHT